MSQIQRFIEAAGSGEVLVVKYSGGDWPGFKRRIIVISVNPPDSMLVREVPYKTSQTYLLSKTEIASENDSAPWLAKSIGIPLGTTPEKYFSHWVYSIDPYFYETLGVFIQYVIDKGKTLPARKAAIEAGMEKKEATRRIKIHHKRWAIKQPPVFEFNEGYIFYKKPNRDEWLQITSKASNGDLCIKFSDHSKEFDLPVRENRLVEILKFGRDNLDGRRNGTSPSTSGIA